MTAYDPTMYDVFHDANGDDVRFYLEQARATGGPVLELGAGTGRTLLPIARAGVEIHGLELDPSMLSALQSKLEAETDAVRVKVRVLAGDMRSFELHHAYAAIHIPFRAFLHNVDSAAQLQCLRTCFEHLKPGGQLALNIFYPSLSFMSRHHDALAGVWRWRDERLLFNGSRVILSDATKYDVVRQIVSSRLRYEVFSDDGLLERTHLLTLELGYLYPSDARERLRAAGFVDVRIEGGFDGRALLHDSDEMVIRATKP